MQQCTKAGRREKTDKGPIPTRLTWEGWSRKEAAERPGACSAPIPFLFLPRTMPWDNGAQAPANASLLWS